MIHILGIESSCDETAASVVSSDRTVLSSVIFSQIDTHAEFGGVVPEIAARSHLEKIDIVIKKAIGDAGITMEKIDAVAATAGPGLIGGVIVGLTAAKTLALATNKPFIAINHLEGHALVPRLCHNTPFPYLLLLASGGHSQILIAKNVGDFQLLGTTIDDAAGEAFDKVAKMMDLGYPGGPAIEKYAKNGDKTKFSLPQPMKGHDNCNLSFSGLKTAVRFAIEKHGEMSEQDKCDLAAAFQNKVVLSICDRLQNAIKTYKSLFPEGKNIVIAGGVAANSAIRTAVENLAAEHGLAFSAPSLSLCTDNAAMIAWAGIERFNNGELSTLSVKPRPRWPLDGV